MIFPWQKQPEPTEIETAAFQQRLYGVVTRARAVCIDPAHGGRHAVGAGPNGALWGDDTAAVVRLNDKLLLAA